MQRSSKDWSRLVFKKAGNGNTVEYGLDLRLTNVYWAVDGTRTIGEIAVQDRYEIKDLIELVAQLSDMGLVVAADHKDSTGQAIFGFLSSLLSDQLGPMGDIVLDDAVRNLGHAKANFPKNRLPILIEVLSQEMENADKAEFFKKIVSREFEWLKS